MAYRRGLVFYFDTKADTGLDAVPVGYKCIIREDNTEFILSDKTGITDTTTVENTIDAGLVSEYTAVIYNIETPSITSPSIGEIDTSIAVSLTSSTYTTGDTFIGGHTGTDWEIASDIGFNTIVFSSYNSANLVSIVGANLSASTEYFVRARYISDSFISEYSPVINFTTMASGISTPSINVPLDNAIDIGKNILIESDAYSTFGHEESHLSTDWQIASDIGFTTIVSESIGDTSNLVSWTSGDLSVDTEYFIRIRYNSTTYSSSYSTVISFTTKAAFGVLIGTPGELGFGVGVALTVPETLTGMTGFETNTSDNFGNYQTSNGSVFVFIPKFYFKWESNNLSISDNDEGGTYALHRAFINAGTEQDGFFISKYGCGNQSNTVVSKAGLDPISTSSTHNGIASLSSVTENIYASALLAVKDFGSNYHCSSIFQMNALALLAYAQGKAGINCAYSDIAPYLPKGNNNNALADVNDVGLTFTSSGYSNCALTGSGSVLAKTTHNGQNCGVADVNGNMYTIAIGLTRPGASATDTANDSYGTNSFYVLKEDSDINNLNMNWTAGDSLTNTTFGDEAYLSGANSPYEAVDIPQIGQNTGSTYLGSGTNQVFDFSTDKNTSIYKWSACAVPSSTGTDGTGTTEFGNDRFYEYHRANLVPVVGGNWGLASGAGVFSVSTSYYRTYSGTAVGFRASSY